MALQNPTPEVKQEVLRLLVQSVLFEDDAITIKHIILTDDKCRLLPRGNMQKHPSTNVPETNDPQAATIDLDRLSPLFG